MGQLEEEIEILETFLAIFSQEARFQPTEIGELVAMKHLLLHQKKRKGRIPSSELSNLDALRMFNLSEIMG